VEAGVTARPPETFSVFEMLAKLRRIDEKLLGHTAAYDACSAEAIFFRNGHALVERCCEPACAHTAGAAADDKEVVVECGHGEFLCGVRYRIHIRPWTRKEKGGKARHLDRIAAPSSGSDVT